MNYEFISRIKVFCFLLIISGCITDIDFEAPGNIQEAIVIQAKVVKGNPSIVDVQVTKTFDFVGQSSTVSVSEVILENVTLGQSISLPKTDLNTRGASIPKGDPEMSINFTDEYRLNVRTVAGDVFISTPEKLYNVPEADSVTYDIVEIETENLTGFKVIDDVIQYKVNSSTLNSENELTRLRWTFKHIFQMTDNSAAERVCYLTDNLGATLEVNYNPFELGEVRLNDFDLLQVITTSNYAEGSYFQAIQQSLSLGAFEYFKEIQEVIEREGGIFDPPAGQIRTNFEQLGNTSTRVFGYFYLTVQDTVRVFVEPNDDITSLSRVCEGPNSRLKICIIDCRCAKNSTNIKPDWWK